MQRAIVETLVRKLLLAAQQEGIPRVVLGGGVAANRCLRARAAEACAQVGVTLVVPPTRVCTDNAAMIAYAGAVSLRSGRRDGATLDARATWPIEVALERSADTRSAVAPPAPVAPSAPVASWDEFRSTSTRPIVTVAVR